MTAQDRTAAIRRNTTLVVLVKSEEEARELLLELADDHRVVAAHVELGDSKYIVPERQLA